MGFFGRLFARKKGGTAVGNFIRKTPASIAVRGARKWYNKIF